MIDLDDFADGFLAGLVCKKVVKVNNYKDKSVAVMPLYAFKYILRLLGEQARLASLANEANEDNLADLQILLWKLEKAEKNGKSDNPVDVIDIRATLKK